MLVKKCRTAIDTGNNFEKMIRENIFTKIVTVPHGPPSRQNLNNVIKQKTHLHHRQYLNNLNPKQTH